MSRIACMASVLVCTQQVVVRCSINAGTTCLCWFDIVFRTPLSCILISKIANLLYSLCPKCLTYIFLCSMKTKRLGQVRLLFQSLLRVAIQRNLQSCCSARLSISAFHESLIVSFNNYDLLIQSVTYFADIMTFHWSRRPNTIPPLLRTENRSNCMIRKLPSWFINPMLQWGSSEH